MDVVISRRVAHSYLKGQDTHTHMIEADLSVGERENHVHAKRTSGRLFLCVGTAATRRASPAMVSTHVYASVHRQGSTQGVHAAT